MFFLVIKKLWNNKALTACLLIGSILAVAMVGSIPLYTDGILQRMLNKDLQQHQVDSGMYPGRLLARVDLMSTFDKSNLSSHYDYFNNSLNQEQIENMGIDSQASTNKLVYNFLMAKSEAADGSVRERTNIGMMALSGYEDHITLEFGRMPAKAPVDGVYEVLAPMSMQSKRAIQLDEVLVMQDTARQLAQPLRVKVVGFYNKPEETDMWWYENPAQYANFFLMDYSLFRNDLVSSNAISYSEWYYALDYSKLRVANLSKFLDALQAKKDWLSSFGGSTLTFPAEDIIRAYFDRERQLRITLWVLQTPVLILLAFYIFMVSQLIVEADRNEIAVLKSRGASNWQIFGKYLLQSAILAGISMVLGLLLAIVICRIVGASNGFLEFVSRTALPIKLYPRTILYCLLAAAFTVVVMMPAMLATRNSIVEYKQRKVRRWQAPLWQKLFLDVILLGVAIYGFYSYQNRQQTVLVSGLSGMEAPLDPFLFLVSTVFVLGAGLLFLRLYPYAIRLISFAGRKIWPPPMYISFIQVGRSGGGEHFLILFLVFTMAIGVFSMNAARTINQNMQDRIHYSVGADITLEMKWQTNTNAVPVSVDSEAQASEESKYISVTSYVEPPFDQVTKLDGAEAAARVLNIPQASLSITGQRSPSISLMCIQPEQFGKVVWYRNGLLPYHINQYLNLMTQEPSALIVSNSILKDFGIKEGDTVGFSWSGQDEIRGVVYAGVDFWPGINPYSEENKYFVVGNYDYVRLQSPVSPYAIWLKKAPGATSNEIYRSIEDKEIVLNQLEDSDADIIEEKNDPLLQGTNGAMTLGFVVTIAISLVGFLIYWILTVRERTLQFGILRAMGMTKGMVLGMLAFEQVIISLAAVMAGLLVGGIMCDLFIPLIGMVYNSADLAPPFVVTALRGDYVRLYLVVGVMLAGAIGLLAALVSRIKANQAIKLGED